MENLAKESKYTLRKMLHRGGIYNGHRLWVTGGTKLITVHGAYGYPTELQTYNEIDGEMVLTETKSLT